MVSVLRRRSHPGVRLVFGASRAVYVFFDFFPALRCVRHHFRAAAPVRCVNSKSTIALGCFSSGRWSMMPEVGIKNAALQRRLKPERSSSAAFEQFARVWCEDDPGIGLMRWRSSSRRCARKTSLRHCRFRRQACRRRTHYGADR